MQKIVFIGMVGPLTLLSILEVAIKYDIKYDLHLFRQLFPRCSAAMLMRMCNPAHDILCVTVYCAVDHIVMLHWY